MKDLTFESYLRKNEIAQYLNESRGIANQLFAWADEIDAQYFGNMRVHKTKVRKSVVCKLYGTTVEEQNAIYEKMRSLCKGRPQMNE